MVKCSICGRTIRVRSWPSTEGLQTLRRHYKRMHGGWKRPATKDRRYKTRDRQFPIAGFVRRKRRGREPFSKTESDYIDDRIYDILKEENLI